MPSIEDGVLPQIPTEVETASIVIRKKHHYYDDYFCSDTLDFYLEQPACGLFALTLLAALMRPLEAIHLRLTHQASQIRDFRVFKPSSRLEELGLHRSSTRFVLQGDRDDDSVATLAALEPQDKPVFRLVSAPGIETWDARRNVDLVTSELSALIVARLLFALSFQTNNIMEVSLECAMGNDAIGSGSAEARFWLPGSIAWEQRYSPGHAY